MSTLRIATLGCLLVILSIAFVFKSEAQWVQVNNGLADSVFHRGDTVMVVLTTDCVDVHSGPSVNDSIYKCEPAGTYGTLDIGPSADNQGASNLQFWYVFYFDGVSGWSASKYLTRTNTHPQLKSMAANGSILFVGGNVGGASTSSFAYGEGVFRSTDNGMNWTPANTGLVNTQIMDLATLGMKTFVATYASGGYQSTDNGSTWVQVGGAGGGPMNGYTIAGPNIYSRWGDYAGWGINLSTDSGATWSKITLAPSTYPILNACGTDIFLLSKDYSTSYRSSDNGITWSEFYTQPIDCFCGKYVFLVNSGGVKRAPDSSVCVWSDIKSGLNGSYVQDVFAIDDNHLYAETPQGNYLSTNCGSTWVALDPSLTFPSHKLAIIGNYVFALTQYSGVWRRSLSDVLPIQLASLEVQKPGPNVMQLIWSTVSEINNFGFSVQISSDEKEWLNVGELVHGHGTTLEPQKYTLTLQIPDGSWWVRLVQLDLDGTTMAFEAQFIQAQKPAAFFLEQNYPNPFNPSTTIKYDLPKSSMVKLSVYDILGREVTALVNERKDAGVYEVKFDGSNLASGVYFYRMQAGSFVQTRKLLFLK